MNAGDLSGLGDEKQARGGGRKNVGRGSAGFTSARENMTTQD